MQIVDDKDVSVTEPVCAMLAQVRMIRSEIRVSMLDHIRVVRRPEDHCHAKAGERHGPEHAQGDQNAGRSTEPVSERIRDQPASMRERELRHEQRRPVGGCAERRNSRPVGVCTAE